MNTNELKSFLMVYEYRSYSLAAKRLFVTQSAVSKRINNLENEFKTKLFETRGNMIFPTMEGQLLIPYARLLLHTLCDAAANLKSPELTEVPIIIGTSTLPCYRFLPLFIEYLNENVNNFPNFHIKQMAKQDLFPALQNGLIDMALTTQDLKTNSSIVCNQLDEEDVYVVVSPQHELANQKELDLKKLAQYTCILTETGFSIRDNLEKLFSKEQLSLLVKHELFSLLAIKKLVKRGLGWSVLPKQYFDEELIKLDIKGYSEKINLCWYCHQNRTDSRLIQYVGQLLRESLPYIHQHVENDM
ncbi:LysR family transcriptional regulator [Legionella longbeachae]|uniref:Putative transcriptional regulator lysR family n=1 Tax=Legionella longbeachae serogroup 1 (strain NSW150) TaxID=661367 RepID=D3HRB4_LEGLN|nr:LysR family transcriptional regulator [Legionella longbeachae]VEE01950.1 LysR family transcriptional regulator [Legionella oakridgensis]HBD7396798.1 LysR family transcriptional regulator [Legionella pneumophila]ARB91737.1 LysR family transcriptional regulator [Legionella longbeachae]ARM35118.1 LysR family transcriptional regulator [Legionella longbeachae]EEZ95446.1 LysR family transcriptional regulator [Legionella longbeachae D-4968]